MAFQHRYKTSSYLSRRVRSMNFRDEEFNDPRVKIIYSFSSEPQYRPKLTILSPMKNPDASLEEKLKSLQCPFTWNMEPYRDAVLHLAQPNILDEKSHDAHEDSIPVVYTIIALMEIFAQCTTPNYIEHKFRRPLKSTQFTISICDLEGLSMKALKHAQLSTKCHALVTHGKKDVANDVLKTIEDPYEMNSIDKSTLVGCRAIACLAFQKDDCLEGQEYIQQAIREMPTCGLWYYILGRYLRHLRKSSPIQSVPTDEEIACFITSFDKSKSPKLRLLIAEMFLEYNKKYKASEMYKTIFNDGRLSDHVFLKLSVGFMKVDKKMLADNCLAILERDPHDASIVMYYRGLYYKTFKQYQKAINIFKKAFDPSEGKPYFPAVEEYASCKLKVDKDFKLVEFLVKTLEKIFSHEAETSKQRVFLHIAFEYHNLRNLNESMVFFFRAIDADPTHPVLKTYYNLRNPERYINVYNFVFSKILKSAENKEKYLDMRGKACYEGFQIINTMYQHHIEKQAEFKNVKLKDK